MWASWPATNARPTSDMPCSSSSLDAITIAPSVPRNDRWMWQELPSRWSYLAMNVSEHPSCAAISLAPSL